MLNTLNDNDEILHFFDSSFAPDEMLIPTIFFNFPFKNNGILLESNLDYMSYCITHKLYYGSKGLKVYSIADFDLIKNFGKMFIRKVKSNFSEDLLNEIDKTREVTNE